MITQKRNFHRRVFLMVLLILVLSSCWSQSAPINNPTVTPTPTQVNQEVLPTNTPVPSECLGLVGELEIQVRVGPADAVGLEPHSVGYLPFAITTEKEPYLIQGSGDLNYNDILVDEWGSYEVTMTMAGTISGTCVSDGAGGLLTMDLELAGTQLVVVISDGFSANYPWEGTTPFFLSFPLEEGSSIEGEGYVIVLHLN